MNRERGIAANTNVELIGEALGFGTEAIGNHRHTANNSRWVAFDAGRAMYIKYAGTLDRQHSYSP